MNIDRLLKRRDAVYGGCAVWIVLFHIYRRISMPFIPVLTNVIGLGNMAVDVFVFYSGLCLVLSAEKHEYLDKGWSGYYRRRMVRILVPYLIVAVPYYLWNCFAEHNGSLLHCAAIFAGNLTSATFWLNGMQTTWFAYAILVYYLLFPLLYRAVKRNTRTGLWLMAGAVALAVVIAYIPVVKNGLVVWARIPVFLAGILTGCNQERIKAWRVRKGILVPAAALLMLLLGWGISLNEIGTISLKQVYRLLLYLPLTLALLSLLTLGRTDPPHVLSLIGTLSFEIYLVHITLLHPLKTYGITDMLGNWLYLVLPLVSILTSFGIKWIENRLYNALADHSAWLE